MGVLEKTAEIEKSLDSAAASIEKLNKSALDGSSGGVADMINSMQAMKDISDKSTAAMLDFVDSIPGLSVLAAPFKSMQSAMFGAVDISIKAVEAADDLGKALDGATYFTRGLNASMYELSSNFAGSYEEAKKFSDYILKTANNLDKAESGFIAPADRIKAAKDLNNAGIPIQKMAESIHYAGGEMDLLSVAFLHSKSLGMDVAAYSQKISDAMMIQGLNVQQAVEQMSMFGEISKEIGLPVESVASNLSGMADKFSLLGIKASFGAPILEGFTKTLNGLGLGTKNALELTSTFSDALVKLTSDYAAAYVTFQRGGLDIGSGGGVLGASIGLRAKSIDAEKNGTQGDLAMELANSMKETLQSFTGGQVITVTEAAASPELQATFYTQTQLLKDLYGIQDTGAQDRTLELLQQLDDATRAGDSDLMAATAKQLEQAKTGISDTIDYQRAAAVGIEATVAQLSLNHKDEITVAKENAKLLAAIAVGVNAKYTGEMAAAASSAMNSLSNTAFDPAALTKQVTDVLSSKTMMQDIADSAPAAAKSAVNNGTAAVKEVADNGIAALTAQIINLTAQVAMLAGIRAKSSTTGP